MGVLMSTSQLQDSVSKSLQSLRNIDTLKKMFWSQLNYERVNQHLSRRTLNKAVANQLTEDPLLLASGGIDNDFHIIYTHLKSEALSRQSERIIVNALLKEHPYTLFVFSNKSQSRWHFINVKYDKTPKKQRLFRRITVGEGEPLRTATERLSKLDLENHPNASTLDIQTLHDEAFDVEKVTQEFFREYRKTFKKVEALITGIQDNEQKRLFTQKLFNRIMFIAFIQKKGWLDFKGNRDYLSALWKDYQDDKDTSNKNFYRDRLAHLFFRCLNNPQQHDIIGINNGGFLKELIGTVPYLNGGLFEEDNDDKNPQIIIPDNCIDSILHDLFQRFAFTVTESTPFDVDVAVDPEMLGKIFEELVTGRHESGSYYTPKPIVSFMCREAIKGYLEKFIIDNSGFIINQKENSKSIDEFVDEHDASNLNNPEVILDALHKVKCCDLACGSGAYLLGMLHELLDLHQSLIAANNEIPFKSIYESKLEIIQNNLYGVDIDVFAVNIARLRLWLSLAVDYEGDKPEPLPNLKYKIEIGDSLTAPSPATTGMIRSEVINQYRQKKAEYLRTSEGGKKENLEKEIDNLKKEVRLITYGTPTAQAGFDWGVEFAEVFADGGFDIIVANPPYVRQELIKHLKPALQKIYASVYTGTSDLYCFFYARALQLLRDGGMLTFITPNKWFRAKYGEKLRKYIAETCQVYSITDFGELPVFASAATFPMIFICQNGKLGSNSTIFTQVKSLEPPYPDVSEIIRDKGQSLPHTAIKDANWVLTHTSSANRLQKMEAAGIPLGEYVKGQIYRGIVTGFNKAFYIDALTRAELIDKDPKSAEIIKALVVGDNVRKWQINYQNKWVIFTKRGLNINAYPAVKQYLTQLRPLLEPKPRNCSSLDKWQGRKSGSYQWYEIQDNISFFQEFQKNKIVFPDIGKSARFTLDKTGYYLDATASCIAVDDLYLLGLLNSNTVWSYVVEQCAVLGDADKGGRIRLKSFYVEKIPIPNASIKERETITKLVQKCLDAKGVNCEQWEKEIDERVATLYGL
ncbi:type I restriction-modification system methyltransferase subunit [Cylindrospermum stagnale PCC 7417]|uniref:site-specific DNA-methyltransferase (adenine-specific) n=2 Tax=Cylindrospermum stagnale TaxID=142864 RepID=K9WTW4_9NOST|nr:type I restriction-modification system methyltransferase subunit [Cylindrospermum stagnale PCC 7417]